MKTEIVRHADTRLVGHEPKDPDAKIINMWLHGRPSNTQKSYRIAVNQFRSFVGKPLHEVTLPDAQAFADTLVGLAPSTQAARLMSLKSLFSFAREVGYLQVDVMRVLRPPRFENKLSERILEVDEVRAMVQNETNHRDRVILELLYFGALRLAELSGLQWRHLQPHGDGGIVTVYGKGGKTRSIRIPPAVFHDIMGIKLEGALASDPVFKNRGMVGRTVSRNIKPRRVEYMVLRAAQRAGIDKPVSPHWLRHSHATHALDAGVPIHVVQKTLGHASLATTELYLHVRPGDSSGMYLSL